MQFETMYMTQRHDSALGFIFFIFFFNLLKGVYSFTYACIWHWNRLKKKTKTKQTYKKQLYNVVFCKRII